MKPLHDLHSTAFSFEFLIQADVERLKRHRKKINAEKDATKIKDILNTLQRLEYDTTRYKEWAEREAEAIEKAEK